MIKLLAIYFIFFGSGWFCGLLRRWAVQRELADELARIALDEEVPISELYAAAKAYQEARQA